MLFNSYEVKVHYPNGRPEGYYTNARYYSRSRAMSYALKAWSHGIQLTDKMNVLVKRVNFLGDKVVLTLEWDYTDDAR